MNKKKVIGVPQMLKAEGTLFTMYFEISSDILKHHRSVYSVLDWLGDIGGLFDALSLICRVLLSSLTTLMFKIGLFNRLFEVNEKPKSQSKLKPRKPRKRPYSRFLAPETFIVS